MILDFDLLYFWNIVNEVANPKSSNWPLKTETGLTNDHQLIAYIFIIFQSVIFIDIRSFINFLFFVSH